VQRRAIAPAKAAAAKQARADARSRTAARNGVIVKGDSPTAETKVSTKTGAIKTGTTATATATKTATKTKPASSPKAPAKPSDQE
jgi:hypothetical protein